MNKACDWMSNTLENSLSCYSFDEIVTIMIVIKSIFRMHLSSYTFDTFQVKDIFTYEWMYVDMVILQMSCVNVMVISISYWLIVEDKQSVPFYFLINFDQKGLRREKSGK